MAAYQRTSPRRYFWGIGFVCSLIFLSIVGTWVSEGSFGEWIIGSSFGVRLNVFGASTWTYEIGKTTHPILFWAIASIGLATALTAVIATGIGLTKTQRDEAKSPPSSAPGGITPPPRL
ncbi:MAG: hypothetical protein V4773_12115 [Verrucomicrobiota bacterium]